MSFFCTYIYIYFLIIPSPLSIFLRIALYLACCFGRIREEFGLQEIYTKDNSIHMSNIPNATEYNHRTRRISIPDKSGFIKYNISKLGNSQKGYPFLNQLTFRQAPSVLLVPCLLFDLIMVIKSRMLDSLDFQLRVENTVQQIPVFSTPLVLIESSVHSLT